MFEDRSLQQKLPQPQAQQPLNYVAISSVNAMLMQYAGWQWKCNLVRKFEFMTSATVLTSPTLVCSVFYGIVLRVKFMPSCALRVSYDCSGNLNFAFPDFCVFKGTSFQNSSTKNTPDWPMCNSLRLWNGSGEFPWLGFLESSGSTFYRKRGRCSGLEWGLCRVRQMLSPGTKYEVMEKERNGEYLWCDSCRLLSNYYMPGIVVSLMFFMSALPQSFEVGFVIPTMHIRTLGEEENA